MKECSKVKRMLSQYLDNETGYAGNIFVKTHLAGCSDCKEDLTKLLQLKDNISGAERKSLPRDYMVSKLRQVIADETRERERFSIAGMGIFARRLIPIPVAAIIASVFFLMVISTRTVITYSIEDHIFSGNATTAETALELLLGSQN